MNKFLVWCCDTLLLLLITCVVIVLTTILCGLFGMTDFDLEVFPMITFMIGLTFGTLKDWNPIWDHLYGEGK